MEPSVKADTGRFGLPLREDCPCPYFGDGRTASIEFLFAADAQPAELQRLLESGYRRLGASFYRNICKGCSSCRPLRVNAAMFRPGKGQRRTFRKNQDIRVELLTPSFVTPEKVALYRRYLTSKHGEKDRQGYDYEAYLSHIHYGYRHAIEMNYLLEGRLVGVGIVDESSQGLSSNYFYYDTNLLSRRLGVFSILQEIALARLLAKHCLYLGFYIEETPKMSYKKFFRPNQILHNGDWKDFLL